MHTSGKQNYVPTTKKEGKEDYEFGFMGDTVRHFTKILIKGPT